MCVCVCVCGFVQRDSRTRCIPRTGRLNAMAVVQTVLLLLLPRSWTRPSACCGSTESASGPVVTPTATTPLSSSGLHQSWTHPWVGLAVDVNTTGFRGTQAWASISPINIGAIPQPGAVLRDGQGVVLQSIPTRSQMEFFIESSWISAVKIMLFYS